MPAPPASPERALLPRTGPRRCPVCGGQVPERLSSTGRRRRGRPRIFCSARCRLGDRGPAAAPDPGLHRAEVAAFAAAVRTAIAGLALSLRDLEHLLVAGYGPLASSVATLSAWQTGSSAPPRTRNGRRRVLALERVLGVPAGDLALLMPGGGLVPLPRPTGRAEGPAGRHARLQHVLVARGGSQQVLPVELAKHHGLGRDRRPRCTLTRMRVRAVHDGVDRFWFVRAADPRVRSTVAGASGCRVGREIVEPGHDLAGPRLVATELCFDRRLVRGERYDFSFLVEYGADADRGMRRLPEPVFRHVQEEPCERLDLSVSFDRAAIPAQVSHCRWRPRDLAEVVRTPKTRRDCWQYRLVVDDPLPGGYGWRWAWSGVPAVTAA